MPFFAMKYRNVENVAEFSKMPSKDKVLEEHLRSLEFPVLDEDILEFKMTLLSREACDKLDKKPVTRSLRQSTLTNTAKFKLVLILN